MCIWILYWLLTFNWVHFFILHESRIVRLVSSLWLSTSDIHLLPVPPKSQPSHLPLFSCRQKINQDFRRYLFSCPYLAKLRKNKPLHKCLYSAFVFVYVKIPIFCICICICICTNTYIQQGSGQIAWQLRRLLVSWGSGCRAGTGCSTEDCHSDCYSQYYLSGKYQECWDIICWRPTAVEDVEANTAVGVDIWMEHSGTKAIRYRGKKKHL